MSTSPIVTPASRPTFGPRVYHLLFAQSLFGLGWSLYLLLPKFYTTALGAGPETIGHISAMNGVANVLAMPLALRLINLGSRKPLFYVGCLVLACVSLGMMTIDRISPMLYVLQGCVGVAFVCTFNASATLVTDEVPPERFGQALGLVGASNMVMNAVSTAAGEALSMRYGWKAVFAMALACCIASMAVAATFRELPRDSAKQYDKGADTGGWGPLLAPLFACTMMGATFIAMFVFYQPYALSLGAETVRDFFIGFTITAVGVRVFLGNLGDRLGRLQVSVGAMLLYGVASLSMVWLRIDLLALHGALLGIAHGVLYPTLNAAAVERVPTAGRGRAMTLFTGAYSVGVGFAALGFGSLAKVRGYPSVFLLGAVLCALGSAVLMASLHAARRA